MKKQWLGLVVLGLIMVGGWSRVSGECLSPECLSTNSQAELRAKANTLLQQGDTNAAVDVLVFCYQRSLQQNADQFTALMNILLARGDLWGVQHIFHQNLAQHDKLTRNHYNFLHQYYAGQADKQVLLDWTLSLQSQDLPPVLRVQVFSWLLDASRSLGPVSRVTDLVPVCVRDFNVPTSRSLLMGAIDAYTAAGNYKAVIQVLDAVDRATRRQPEWRRWVVCQRVNLSFTAGQWAEAESLFEKEAKALPDGDLTKCFQHAMVCAGKANQVDLPDRLCAWILKKQKNKPMTWQAAAGVWLANAQAQKKVGEITPRLEKLMRQKCPADTLLSFYFKYWKYVAKDGKPADMIALLKFNERLSATVVDQKAKDRLRLNAVEGCFMLEDYTKALQLLEEPLSMMSPVAQDQSVNKIKAHLALQKGDKQEAIKRFRAFMDAVKTWTKPNLDPLTGQVYTKEMYLGLNAKRIGDILKSMNDAKGAKTAYKEASRYYVMAGKKFHKNTPEGQYIKSHQDELVKLLK